MITWVQKFHCKSFSQFDFHTGRPYLICLKQRVLSFKSRDEFFLVFFFKENIPCNLLFCIQAGIVMLSQVFLCKDCYAIVEMYSVGKSLIGIMNLV